MAVSHNQVLSEP